MARDPASRDRIVAAARALVEADGVDGLSMRKVAAEVGLAPTAIYWHVGSRDDLLGAVLDEQVADLPALEASGSTARARIESLVHAARREFLDGMATLQLANALGRGNELSLRSQVPLARELTDAGLEGEAAATALRSLMFLIGGFVVIEDQYRQRRPGELGTQGLWAELDEPGVPVATREAMAGPTDTEDLFTYTLERLLDGILGPIDGADR